MAPSPASPWRFRRGPSVYKCHILGFVAILLLSFDATSAQGPEGTTLGQFMQNNVTGFLGGKANFITWNTIGEQDPCVFRYIGCSGGSVNSINLAALDLVGYLDPRVSGLTNLQILYINNNTLGGQIPSTIGELKHLEIIDMSFNNFSGTISPKIGDAVKLKRLNFSNNHLTGNIPPSFANLSQLKDLNLASNNLSGPIPSGLLNLETLDLSNNNLSGPIPLELAKFCTSSAFDGNPLIDRIICTYSPPPPPPSPPLAAGESSGTPLGLIVGVVVGALVIGALLGALLLLRHRHKRSSFRSLTADLLPRSGSSSAASHYSFLERVRRFTLAEMLDATEEFNDGRQLGEGGASVVYRGDLPPPDDRQIAVKRLKNYYTRGNDQFIKEIDIISRTVHVNLLRLEGFCLEAGERILIFPFMSNGSVASHLKGGSRPPIPVGVKRSIARDVAEGLSYIHWDCSPQLLHRDIKADNILLTNTWDAKVADFGLAKAMDDDEEGQQTVLRGTIGHIAPEYHMSGSISDRTDVFAFGVFLVEVVLGRPMSELADAVPDGYTLQEWVVALLQQDSLRDAMYGPSVPQDEYANMEELLQLAALCMQEQPEERLSTKECCVILRGEGLGDRWSQWQNPDTGAISIVEDDPLGQSRGPNWTGPNSAIFSEGGQSTDWQHSQAYPIDLSGPR